MTIYMTILKIQFVIYLLKSNKLGDIQSAQENKRQLWFLTLI